MGDIARHRDIFLNTQEAVPLDLLGRCRLTRDDLTYLELGNYFTDVSQFRDPVFYLFAKQTVWREEVLPAMAEHGGLTAAKAVAHLALMAVGAAAAAFSEGKTKAWGAVAALSPALAILDNTINAALADAFKVDDWIDRMLGRPIEKLNRFGKRNPKDYGFIGQFFEHFIEGITHLLFAQDVPSGPGGKWGEVARIPSPSVSDVFAHAFTQYFPHEHTDQPPYIWDASRRPGNQMYEPAPRRTDPPQQGIMGIVHNEYIGYLAERLTILEDEFRGFGPTTPEKRRIWLIEMGKVLHGIEDWFFHSNIVELLRVHARQPNAVPTAGRQAFLKSLIRKELKTDRDYAAAGANQPRLERLFYRRIHFPAYGRGTKENSGGVASTTTSMLSWDHVYPAFPSTRDTGHTLLGALETLEAKLLHPGGGGTSLASLASGKTWLECLITKFHDAGPDWSQIYHEKARERHVTLDAKGRPELTNDPLRIRAWTVDVLRELVPLVLTLLHQRERQRLVVDIPPMDMPLNGSAPRPRPGVEPGKGETKKQIERHVNALKPKKDVNGVWEHNYARAARYFRECGSLNAAGEEAIKQAFAVDVESEKHKVNEDTPGAGGFLIKFAVRLQKAMDIAVRVSAERDLEDPFASVATDNGSDNEVIGSHSLMSKDTVHSGPLFDDARVLGAVASAATFQIMLEEVSAPSSDRLNWRAVLRRLIRFPRAAGGWERQALALSARGDHTPIPRFADINEFADLRKIRLPSNAARQLMLGKRTEALRQKYVDLEKKLTGYRYP